MLKKLLFIGIMLTSLCAYDFQTSKSNSLTFTSLPQKYLFSDFSKISNLLALPSLEMVKSNYLEGVLPQVLPSAFLPPDLLQTEIISEPKKREFLISYQLYVKNGIPKGERYSISEPIKTRINSSKYTFDYRCSIDTYIGDFVNDDGDYALKIILELKKDSVLECLYKSGVKIIDDTFTNNLQTRTQTTLSLPARAVNAYLDNGFLILEVYKEKK
ncbi:hypothetical protein BKH42_07400 [Helicobacter sp. 13S00482-2]|uniref:hypothetical protein n=1 Tax=Helicobacter sp. 13S00482-2 TaxID=1476200 RepID=UPI000BA6F6C4|nr:hypothetical protein [Helicobacter sp. 13S00482-2]PAF53164.1 hypothetical protein BKH42_07400 [Helicobacter sp. 13S00482-2]